MKHTKRLHLQSIKARLDPPRFLPVCLPSGLVRNRPNTHAFPMRCNHGAVGLCRQSTPPRPVAYDSDFYLVFKVYPVQHQRIINMDQSTDQDKIIIPLNHPLRTTPIHPLLPEIRVPAGQSQHQYQEQDQDQTQTKLQSHHYNPITCTPIPLDNNNNDDDTTKEYQSQLATLRTDHPTPDTALRAQEAATKEAKRRFEELVRKREEVQKAIDKKVKERDTEMKVLSKFQEVRASDILPG